MTWEPSGGARAGDTKKQGDTTDRRIGLRSVKSLNNKGLSLVDGTKILSVM